MQYGLVGASLGHSFSKEIHERLGSYPYELCQLTPEALDNLLEKRDFSGINVTIPYKQHVIPFCSRLDDRARRIGAVNTVVNENGVLAGYNTDYYGFSYLLRHMGLSLAGQTVLVLGNGGTTKTVRAVAEDEGAAAVHVASRSGGAGTVTYAEAARLPSVSVIVNASPAGMFPNNAALPFDPAAFPALRGVVDVVYNPLQTRLVLRARELGLPAAGGLLMLVAQAKAAAELFLGRTIPDGAMLDVYRDMRQARTNLVLIGMPGSGKTTAGRLLAGLFSRPFVDMDDAVAAQAGMGIPQIFKTMGEAAFRDMEAAAAEAYGRQNGLVIATGGGAVLRRENVDNLKQNGVLALLDRPAEQLRAGNGRPLAKTREDLARLAEERLPLYRRCADFSVAPGSNAGECAAALAQAFGAYLAQDDATRCGNGK